MSRGHNIITNTMKLKELYVVKQIHICQHTYICQLVVVEIENKVGQGLTGSSMHIRSIALTLF